MRLKSIKLAGFKSFAEPVKLAFPSNVTCIVGPNGCGKSNTLDAIRWVMGESSARNLRGGELNDVLFNGTDRRKPVSQCSVELIFDNSDHALKGPWNRYAEISVRRVHHREQGTQYYLNGQRCRKRDVQALFDGTGLGPRSYALIGQGNISQIIEARPEQLRLFLEEVAGIGFYRQRRREALSRLQATEENLAQLQIQHDTWAEQVAVLREQSDSARRWQALKEEIAQLRRRYFQARFQALLQRQQRLERDFHTQQHECLTLQQQAEDAQKALVLAQKQTPELEKHLTEARQKVHDLDKRLALAQAAREAQDARKARLQEQLAQLAGQLQQVQETLSHLEHAQATLKQTQVDPDQLQALEKDVENLQLALKPLDETWQTTDRQLRQQRYRYQEAQSILQRLVREQDQLAAQLEAARSALESIQQEKETLAARQAELDLETLASQAETAEKARQEASARLQASQQRFEQLQSQIDTLIQQRNRLEADQARMRAEQEGLSDLQSKALADATPPPHSRPLIETLKIGESEWIEAIERWLDHWLKGWVAEQWPQSLEVTCIVNQHVETPRPVTPPMAQWRPLTSLLQKAPPALQMMAAQVFCADTMPWPEQLAQLEPHQCVLTRDGRLWWRHGLEVRQPQKTTGLLARQARLDELNEQLSELKGELAALEQEQAQLTAQQDAVRSQVAERQQRLKKAEQDVHEAQRALQQAQDRFQMLTEQQQRLDERAVEAQQKLEKLSQRLQEAQQKVSTQTALAEDLSKSGETLEKEHQRLQQERSALQKKLQAQSQKLRELSQAWQHQQQEQQRLTRQIEAQHKLHEQLSGQKSLLEHELTALSSQREAVSLESLSAALQAAQRDREKAEAEWQQHQTQVDMLRQRLGELEKAQLRAEQTLDRLSGQLDQTHDALQRCREQALEIGLTEVQLRQHGLEAEQEEQISQALKRAEQALDALGPVNMTAIEQLSELEAKLSELVEQIDDLQSAVETLRQSIAKLDRDSRRRLREVFEAVNVGFQRMFPTVFRGGRAALAWADEQLDPLENGVLVMAQPPGKRNSRIQMLSGGEKTLTALALLFAIFELNPAPFCVLDEVDAPLDDANVVRFGELVKSMSDRVQFILITHNKTTMTMASELLGVTMQEPGVSRVVAVDLEAAVEMSEEASV